MEYQYFDDAVVGRLAVITGRADVSFEPNATGAYSARDGKVRRVGLFPGGWPNAAAISVTTRKGSGLADAVTQALNTQIASGTYAQALKRWNVAEEAVPQSQTNPPGLPTLQRHRAWPGATSAFVEPSHARLLLGQVSARLMHRADQRSAPTRRRKQATRLL